MGVPVYGLPATAVTITCKSCPHKRCLLHRCFLASSSQHRDANEFDRKRAAWPFKSMASSRETIDKRIVVVGRSQLMEYGSRYGNIRRADEGARMGHINGSSRRLGVEHDGDNQREPGSRALNGHL